MFCEVRNVPAMSTWGPAVSAPLKTLPDLPDKVCTCRAPPPESVHSTWMCAADCTADHRRRDDKQLQVPSSTGLAAGIWMNLLPLAGSSGRSPPTSCLATPSAALVAATSAKTRTCMRALADPDSLWVLDMQVRVDRAPVIDGSAHRDVPSHQLRRQSGMPVPCGRPAAKCLKHATVTPAHSHDLCVSRNLIHCGFSLGVHSHGGHC